MHYIIFGNKPGNSFDMLVDFSDWAIPVAFKIERDGWWLIVSLQILCFRLMLWLKVFREA